MKNSKPNVLCVCAVGINRSKYLATYLKTKGYHARFGGIDYRNEGEYNPLRQKDVDWADVIIIVRKRLMKIFKKKYNFAHKRVIALDVTDSKKRIPKKFNYLTKLSHKDFQKKWTYSELRKSIKPYLPLEKAGNYVIIRGPLGCGKSTVSKKLAKELGAEYFAVDRVLDEFGLTKYKEEGYISQKSFFKANEIIVKRAKPFLEKGKSVIFDGNFYWKSAIEDLISKLNYGHQVFTLKASVETCITRDKKRRKTHGEDAARAVHKKATSFKYGEIINTENKSIDETLLAIKRKLSH